MVEIGTKENSDLLSETYERIMGEVHAGREVSVQENFVFQIELLSQEVNSGASFEQYFRWVGKEELDQILGLVEKLDLPPVCEIVSEAISVAFPNGVPDNEDDYEACTEWSEAQEAKLERLFEKFEDYNGVIINMLGQFIKDNNMK